MFIFRSNLSRRVAAICAVLLSGLMAQAGEKIQFSGRSTNTNTNRQELPWDQKTAFPSFSMKGIIGTKSPDPDALYVPPSGNAGPSLTRKQRQQQEDDQWWILKTPEKPGDKAKNGDVTSRDSDKDGSDPSKERKTLLEKYLAGDDHKEITKSTTKTNEFNFSRDGDKSKDFFTGDRSPFASTKDETKTGSPTSPTNRVDTASRNDGSLPRQPDPQSKIALPEHNVIRSETFKMLGISLNEKSNDESSTLPGIGAVPGFDSSSLHSTTRDLLSLNPSDSSRSGLRLDTASSGSFGAGLKIGPDIQNGPKPFADLNHGVSLSGNNPLTTTFQNPVTTPSGNPYRPAFEKPAVLEVPKRKF